MSQRDPSGLQGQKMVFELSLTRLILLVMLVVPVIILAYVWMELASLQYGPRNLTIDFTINRNTYRLGEEASVSVKVSSRILGGLIKVPAGGVDVAIELRNPGGNVVFVDQDTTSMDGTLEFKFRIPGENVGEYVFYLACKGGSNSGRLRVEP